MAVAALTSFPSSIVAGNTVRVTLSDSDFPSSSWALTVVLASPTASHSFEATAISANQFEIVMTAADTAGLSPGPHNMTSVYTSGGERTTVDYGTVQVIANPAATPTAIIERQILDAMKAALLVISADTDATVNFNGQSYTGKNPKDLQDAIARQQSIVSAIESTAAGRKRSGNILTRFSRISVSCED